MDSSRINLINDKLNEFINDGKILGVGVSGRVGNSTYTFTSGYQDIKKTKPMKANTIIRLASESKTFGTVAFLKLLDQGTIVGTENIATWIPEFATTKVINPFISSNVKKLENPFTLILNSTQVLVKAINHGLITGDIVGFSSSDISVLNNIYPITVVDSDTFTIELSVPSSESSQNVGGNVTLSVLEKNVKQSVFNNVSYYYKEDDLVRPIKIWHILTHTLGYIYNVISQPPGGYVDNRKDKIAQLKTLIQAGIFSSLNFPAAFPITHDDAYSSIKKWAKTLASVPLLFQPGTEWCYGPSTSLLGALIEYIDGRTVEQYFKDEITTPLNMNDTGFFIHDDDPFRAEKISRIQELNIVSAPNVFLPGPKDLEGYFYDESFPKNLPLIDGGMYSTLEDRNKFFNMLLNNGRANGKFIISPATLSTMSHNRILDIPLVAGFPPETNLRWGLGTGVSAGTDYEYPIAGQTKRAIRWGGFFGTKYTVDWSNKSFTNFITNTLTQPSLYALYVNIHYSSILKICPNDPDASSNAAQKITNFVN